MAGLYQTIIFFVKSFGYLMQIECPFLRSQCKATCYALYQYFVATILLPQQRYWIPASNPWFITQLPDNCGYLCAIYAGKSRILM